MKKSNVVSVRLDNKEMEALEIYSKIFNTDKTSTIIKSLLTMNPYLNILKNIIKNLDDKESKLTSLKLDFRNDKDFTNAIDKKIECIDSFRTDILNEIDTQIKCLSLVHSLIPKNDGGSSDCSDEKTDCYSDEEIYYGYDYDDDKEFDKVFGKSSNSNSSELDNSGYVFDFDFDKQYEDLEGDELVSKYEEDERIDCEKMKNRVRAFLKHF